MFCFAALSEPPPDPVCFPSQINMIQSIVAEINIKTGESECRYYKERLLYLEESQRDLLIDSSRILSCHGELKNNRGAVSIIHRLTDPVQTRSRMDCILT